MESGHVSKVSDTTYDTHYCSAAEATKLITHPFDGDGGNKKRLRAIIENEDVAFELGHPNKHDV